MEVREPSARYLVKPGFKQTEVGVIPSDWEVKSLSELGTFEKGKGLLKGDIKPYGSTPAIPYTALYTDFSEIVNHNHIQWFVDDLAGTYVTNESCLLVASSSNMAENTGKASALVVGKPVAIGREIIVFKSSLNPIFVSYLLSTSLYRRKTLSLARGTTIKHVYPATFHNYKIALPSQVEQEAIAEALSDADALIEALEQLLAKKRQIKQGAMQELLTGQKRLPGFEQKSGYKQTDLGSVPEDWDVIPIGQAAQCLIGLTYSPNDVRSFGTLVLRSSNVQNGCLAFDDNVYVEMELPARVITQEDDILICVRNGSRQLIGKCALIDEAAAGSAFGAFMAVLRSKSSRFLFQQFQSHILKRQISDVMGATINQITNKDMAAFKVIWPVLESEQTAIATVLSDLDAELAALETKLTKARQLKLGMMQELLTGRVRLV